MITKSAMIEVLEEGGYFWIFKALIIYYLL